MCNDYRLEVDIASIIEDFENLKIKIRMPEGKPNIAARADIKMTDMAPIVRSVEGDQGAGEMVNRRWSWPGSNGRPVYNFRTEGREFRSHRCLILADGFYKFTEPSDPKQKRLDKWLFTMGDQRWFCIAGIWRESPAGKAFTMLTMDAGPDVSPYHHRQIIPLRPDQYRDWLDTTVPAQAVLGWLPSGSLPVTQVYGAPPAQQALL